MRYALLILLLIPFAAADEYIFDSSLYQAESLTVMIGTEATVELSGDVRELEATLHYYPRESGSQHVRSLSATPPPEERDGTLVFTWERPSGDAYLTYDAVVESGFDRPRILSPVAFPYRTVPAELSAYLASEDIIRITPDIRAQASRIVGDEDDAVRVAFLLGSWVKDNIAYNLTSVTADASQTSDWVLESGYGVCDELTSLFIAMLRSQGIPARFVSGIAYTNLEELDTNWGPHGWAEVWFPGTGWVPYDVTYGQYGFVDATHITFTTSSDASTSAVEYSMLGRGADFSPSPLSRQTRLLEKGGDLPIDLIIEVEPALDSVGFGGYNRVDATVRNTRNYYVSQELFLARTTQLTTDDYSRSILLGPREERRVSWLVRVSDDLEDGFTYTFPVVVHTNQNRSSSSSFQATSRGVVATQDMVSVEEESGSTALSGELRCTFPEQVRPGEEVGIRCVFPRPVTLCLTECAVGTEISERFTYDRTGVRTVIATAREGDASQQQILTIAVLDAPNVTVDMEGPDRVSFSEEASIVVRVAPDGAAVPSDVTVTVKHPLFSRSWDLDALTRPTALEIRVPGNLLHGGRNTVVATVSWEADGERLERSAEHTIEPLPENFGHSGLLVWNRVVAWFASAFS